MKTVLIEATDDIMHDDFTRLADALAAEVYTLPDEDSPHDSLARLATEKADTIFLLSEAALMICGAVENLFPLNATVAGLLSAGNPFDRYDSRHLAQLRRGLKQCGLIFTTDPRDSVIAEMLTAARTHWLGLPVLASPFAPHAPAEKDPRNESVPRIAVLPTTSADEPEAQLPALLIAAAVSQAEIFHPCAPEAQARLTDLELFPRDRIRFLESANSALKQATCGIMLTSPEPFGHLIATTIQHDVAMVTADAPTLAMFLQTGVGAAWKFTALREALGQLAWSPARRASQIERARLTLLDRFSASAIRHRFTSATNTFHNRSNVCAP